VAWIRKDALNEFQGLLCDERTSMETLGASISNRVEHTDGLAASLIPELLPRASVTAFLDRLEQLETHRTLAELLVAPCRERDMV
jgi:ATP-dependent protease Clp ATPase subunit